MTCVLLLDQEVMLHWHICIDCNLCKASSIIIDIAPRLPWLPIFEGKFIKSFNSLFRSPHCSDCISASQVSLLDLQCLINVCRYKFDAAMFITKTPWSRYGNIWQYIVVFILLRVSGLSGGHPWIYYHVQKLKSRPQTGVSDTDRQQYIYHFHNYPDILIYSISSTSNKTLHCMITRWFTTMYWKTLTSIEGICTSSWDSCDIHAIKKINYHWYQEQEV